MEEEQGERVEVGKRQAQNLGLGFHFCWCCDFIFAAFFGLLTFLLRVFLLSAVIILHTLFLSLSLSLSALLPLPVILLLFHCVLFWDKNPFHQRGFRCFPLLHLLYLYLLLPLLLSCSSSSCFVWSRWNCNEISVAATAKGCLQFYGNMPSPGGNSSGIRGLFNLWNLSAAPIEACTVLCFILFHSLSIMREYENAFITQLNNKLGNPLSRVRVTT